MENDRLKVLFIAGSGRSGSTILQNILGQIDGIIALGELRYFWERGLLQNKLCGCGVPARDCELWNNVMEAAFGGMDGVDAKKMFRWTESFRIKDLTLSWVPGIRRKHMSRLSAYLQNLEIFYEAIRSTTGSNVVVDSSKNPSYGYVLRMIPTIDLYVLHFIRDSQAVAYSWSKKKLFEPGDYMARKSSVKSALQWDARNITAEMFLGRTSGHYMFLRYEDFVKNPEGAVESIIATLGEREVDLPFVAADIVELTKANHSVFGNAVRFQNGPVKLQLDDKWQTKMKKKDKLTVKAITWPLRVRYGYF